MNLQQKTRTNQYMVDAETGRISFLDTRFYFHEPTGDYFPSVTTILGMAYPKDAMFFEWLKQNGEDADRIRDEAGEFGSVVHGMTEDYDKGLPVTILDEFGRPKYKAREWKFFEKYVDFTNRFSPVIENIEVNMTSGNLRTAGTLDRKIELEHLIGKAMAKRKYILDIKTSNLLHDSYWLQLATYKRMWNEANPGDQIDGVCILWLNAKTRTEGKGDAIQGVGWQLVFPPKELDHYDRLWDATRLLYDEQFGDMKPKNLSYQLSYQKSNE